MRLSYSALQTFRRCPLKFKFEYIDKIPAPKSKEALFGTLVHNALKMMHEPGLLIPTEEEILKFIANNWNPSIYESEQESSLAFAQAIKMMKDYYAKNYPAQFNVVALETSFEVPVEANNETHLITGKIDRIDKTADGLFEVIDYKTTKKMPSQADVEKDLQLSLYHLGLINRWPNIQKKNRPVKVSLYFLKHGEKLSSMRQPEQLEVVKEGAIKTIEEISKAKKDDKFSPLPNQLCDWCAYQKHCPFFKHKFREEKLVFEDQEIKKLLNEYLTLKSEIEERDERMDEIKTVLGKFMDQEGMERLFGEDGYVTRTIIQRFKYDADLLKQILEPLGKWNDILKVDDTKLKTISKELPKDSREKIEEARKLDKEYKAFSVKKGKKKQKEN